MNEKQKRFNNQNQIAMKTQLNLQKVPGINNQETLSSALRSVNTGEQKTTRAFASTTQENYISPYAFGAMSATAISNVTSWGLWV